MVPISRAHPPLLCSPRLAFHLQHWRPCGGGGWSLWAWLDNYTFEWAKSEPGTKSVQAWVQQVVNNSLHMRHAPAEWNLREIFRCPHRFWRELLWKYSDTQPPGKRSTWKLSGPVLRDTARLSQRSARSGVFVSQHGQLGAIPLPLFWAFPPWRACEVEVDIGAMPHENKAQWVRYPPLRYYLKKVLRDMGQYLALGG